MSKEDINYQILKYMRDNNCQSTIEAVLDFCKEHEVEVEVAAQSLNENLIHEIRKEGIGLRLVEGVLGEELDV